MPCSRKDVQHPANNAAQVAVVICKPFSSDEDLDHIYHVVVLHPESRRSSSFSKSFEGFFKPLFKQCHYWIRVSGSHLPISYLLHESPHFTEFLLGEGMFHDVLIDGCIDEEPDRKIECHYSDSVCREPRALFESGEDGVEVIRVTFNDWEEVDLCALLDIICMDTLHPAIPVGFWELRILGFDRPPCCPECIARSEE
ncbi:hypothetical protein KUCAC02_011858 [Chaenocephalus aceratus]|uniref:Uncharacterized protein n=1 Tax=Chaenocephalus aceratus TaxID=36190 RepID=A0ACB9XAX4_CHAAC|nr:hypothetical protein KUCAC02_011858 [Chaenocephalus aceratus]